MAHQCHHAAKVARLGTVDYVVATTQVESQNNDNDNKCKTADYSADNQTDRRPGVRITI